MSKPKLNQIVAVVSQRKQDAERSATEVYKKVQKAPLFDGLVRRYQPLDDEGERFPAEKKNPQYSVKQALSDLQTSLRDVVDTVLTQDVANCEAKANVVVDGTVVLKDVPVSTLLFLEKKLTDIHTFVEHLPVLDPAESWQYDKGLDLYKTEETTTNKTKKVKRNHVKAEATDKHPAQVETYDADVVVGEWHTTKFSGAMTQTDKQELQRKVRKLSESVKMAREQANMTDVTPLKAADDMFKFLFGGGN